MSKRIKIKDANSMVENEVRSFEIDGAMIAVCKIKNKFYAFDEICSHQYASLAEGWLEGYAIECPMHGAQFDVRTGEALSLPAVESIRTYPVTQEGDLIYVHLEE